MAYYECTGSADNDLDPIVINEAALNYGISYIYTCNSEKEIILLNRYTLNAYGAGTFNFGTQGTKILSNQYNYGTDGTGYTTIGYCDIIILNKNQSINLYHYNNGQFGSYYVYKIYKLL